MATVVGNKKKYAYEDYVNTSDDERYEFVEGKSLMNPSPVPKHQRNLRKLEFILEKFVSDNRLIFHNLILEFPKTFCWMTYEN